MGDEEVAQRATRTPLHAISQKTERLWIGSRNMAIEDVEREGQIVVSHSSLIILRLARNGTGMTVTAHDRAFRSRSRQLAVMVAATAVGVYDRVVRSRSASAGA